MANGKMHQQPFILTWSQREDRGIWNYVGHYSTDWNYVGKQIAIHDFLDNTIINTFINMKPILSKDQ